MKKIVLIAMTAAAAIATPAMAETTADVTGTINITGTVAPKCFVLNGETESASFTADVEMGELADTDGTLLPSATLATQFATEGGAALDVRVLCTSATPDISVKASPLVGNALPTAGYTNTVNYQADVTFSLVGGVSDVVSDSSTDANATSDTLTARLNGTGTNVSIRTSEWAATGVLTAGEYEGQIVINIAPGA